LALCSLSRQAVVPFSFRKQVSRCSENIPHILAECIGDLNVRATAHVASTGGVPHLFCQQVLFDQQADGVGKAIAWIKEHYARSFTVEELAQSTNMSVSGLHHKFKAITTMGPLQYQKHLRLQQARRLLLSGSLDATTAALAVGYDSPSQFSREYRRLFGLPPLQDRQAGRKRSAASQSHERTTV
jgi:AraC-like DNA-binding protein